MNRLNRWDRWKRLSAKFSSMSSRHSSFSVIPAKAGIQKKPLLQQKAHNGIIPEEDRMKGAVGLLAVKWSFTADPSWIPAFAGMTRGDEATLQTSLSTAC